MRNVRDVRLNKVLVYICKKKNLIMKLDTCERLAETFWTKPELSLRSRTGQCR